LIDVEHDFSGMDMDMNHPEIAETVEEPEFGSPPFEPFEPEDDLDENMEPGSSHSRPQSSIKSRDPRKAGMELESQVEEEEADTYSLAKCYFDSKELERCKRVLQGCRSKKAVFLRLYSVYLVSLLRVEVGSHSR
jgi:hypothetical protein